MKIKIGIQRKGIDNMLGNKMAGKRAVTAGVLCFIMTICSVFIASPVGALSKMGSRGEEVKQIQTKLIAEGLLSGKADGIFGTKTKAAVTAYQKKNGLTQDGIAGPKTLAKMGITKASGGSAGNSSSADYNLLARIISGEARGEPYSGQVAVGGVIMNRMKHPSFPDTMSGVIYQKGAFSAIDDGQFDQPIADSCYKAAQDALNGMDPSGGAIYYYNPKTATNKWIRSRKVIKTIGAHVFCE